MIKNCDVYNVTAKMAINTETLPIRAAILDFRWAIYFHLMQHFVGGTYSGKVKKRHHCIFIGSKDMSMKAAWGVIVPAVGHRRVKIEVRRNRVIMQGRTVQFNISTFQNPPFYLLIFFSFLLFIYGAYFLRKWNAVVQRLH